MISIDETIDRLEKEAPPPDPDEVWRRVWSRLMRGKKILEADEPPESFGQYLPEKCVNCKWVGMGTSWGKARRRAYACNNGQSDFYVLDDDAEACELFEEK